MKTFGRAWCLGFAFLAGFAVAAPAWAKKDWTLGSAKYKPAKQKILRTRWSKSLKAGKPSKRYYPETSSPVEHDGVVYVGTQGGFFYAVDRGTGNLVWRFKNGEPVAAAAAVSGGRVYFADLEGRVSCLNAADGTLLWRQEFDGELLGKPLVAQDRLYLLKGEQELLALSQDDGHTVWRKFIRTFVKDITMRGHADVVADGQRLYVGLADGQLYALQAGDGKILWNQNLTVPLKTFKDIDAAVVVEGDSLYVGGYFGRFYRLNKATGNALWSAEVGTGVSPLVLGDRVIVSDERGRVVGLDKGSGRQLWFSNLNKSVLSGPVAFGGRVFVATYDHDAFLLDAADGTPLQKIGVSSGAITAPFADAHNIILLTNDAKLVGLSPR